MNYDVVKDRFGRLYQQPRQLAKNGFTVKVGCISYRRDEDISETHAADEGQLVWLSWSVGLLFWRLPLCLFFLIKEISGFRPDVIIAGSDQIHIVAGYIAARKCRCKFAVDLYDNFESFGIGRIPLLNQLYRFSLSKAGLITCISPLLENKLRSKHKNARLECLLSTIDKASFRPIGRLEARKKMFLPADSILVGTAGNLRKKMGVQTLFEAIEKMEIASPKITFVLAGIYGDDCPIPKTKNVIYLGKLDHSIIPYLVNSLDVAIIYQSDNDYGKYAFPQKAFEFAACRVPIVAAKVGCMPDIFKDISQYMYEWNNSASLIEAIQKQVVDKKVSEVKIDDWEAHGNRLTALITGLVEQV